MKLEFSKFSEVINDPHSNGTVETNLTELYRDFKDKLSSKESESQRRLMFGEFQQFITQKLNKHHQTPLVDLILKLRLFYPTKFFEDAPAPLPIYQDKLEQLSVSHKYILNTLKRRKFDNEGITILSRFFTLEDEMNGASGPSWHMLDYLDTITTQLHKALLQKNTPNLDTTVFQIVIRYNLNKEDIYQYYVKRMDVLLSDKKNRKVILNTIEAENLTPVRADMFYDKNANSLSQDIQAEIEKRKRYISDEDNGYLPLQFNESSPVYLTVIGVLVELNFIDPLGSDTDFHKNLCKITRGPKNGPYSPTTVKNEFKFNKNHTLVRAREIFAEGINFIDKTIESKSK